MFKKTILMLSLLFSSTLLADSDLVLPNERWEAKFTGYLCQAYGDDVTAPNSHQNMDVRFETVTTDRSLDNGLIKAIFNENGETCRYSALMFADNDASTIRLVESKAYSTSSDSRCENGRRTLDQQLDQNDYLYWGHPHRLTIMVPTPGAEKVCGEDATHVGLNFQVSGLIQ